MSERLGNLENNGSFIPRHVGPSEGEIKEMLDFLGHKSLDSLIEATVPKKIRTKGPLNLDAPLSEFDALNKLKTMANKNKIFRSYIGMGYYNCITPGVIQRNILENPGWYTQYTPYQAEIAQGRLEALLNFQTMVTEMTKLEIANASLLDESTAAAEAMALCFSIAREKGENKLFFVSEDCHPQTIAVVQTRARALGVEVAVGNHNNIANKPFGVLLQYPTSRGSVEDYRKVIEKTHADGGYAILAADLLSLALLTPPGELGADIAVGSTQRFGIPLGFGGPHAAYFATKDEMKRRLPGRIIGVSKDAQGKLAIRMALQTREQHIRREKATSNICTSQVLLAIMAGMYAVYHGPKGIKSIAESVHAKACTLAAGLSKLGFTVNEKSFFDTLSVTVGADFDKIQKSALAKEINLRSLDNKTFGISVDETTTPKDLTDLLDVFSLGKPTTSVKDLTSSAQRKIDAALERASTFLTQKVFNTHHSETKMLRYIRMLESRDLSLTRSMIPLGSCTMKLNATAELYPVSWPQFNQLHPFAPADQTQGYLELFKTLENQLKECTGFDGVSLQPNSGAQGEFAGLLVIAKYHETRGEAHRDICLIPKSAHGTNPASAVLAGMKVVVVDCDDQGNINIEDLKAKAAEHKKNLSCLMVTYPSTHGVFEEGITEICDVVHAHGGQVYMDGANMNAQVGLCKPGEFGPDVCHLNLHKTFCIPHGGGGPGMGPIAVKKHLVPHLPSHPVVKLGDKDAVGPVSAAPWGSASILPISLMYVWMMGAEGLKRATEVAILNANYVAKRLDAHFPVLYKGKQGMVAHECIVDLRQLKAATGIEVTDVSKRLMDYGFHAPTESFPVAGTLMIEPTESEGKAELDNFCESLIAIREEIREIETGKANKTNNLLKNAPHTADVVLTEHWDKPYSRERAVFPTPSVRENKFWPSVSRIDAAYGDRNLMCTCAPIEDYAKG